MTTWWFDSDAGYLKFAPASFAAGASLMIFYHLFNLLLQYRYYTTQSASVADWKCQPTKVEHLKDWRPWIPALELLIPGYHKSGRRPLYTFFSVVNTWMSGCCAVVVVEFILRGYSKMYYHDVNSSTTYLEHITDAPWKAIAIQFLIAVVHENVVEYYWHRLMHLRWCYVRMHKIHHSNKAPEPFDDMVIHPVEAFGYYCILYSPPFIYTSHVFTFVLYMILMGITGVLDHSGIKFHIPGLYNTEDHDAHHSQTTVNYGFPFPWLDILHGTFEGNIWGRTFTTRKADDTDKKSS